MVDEAFFDLCSPGFFIADSGTECLSHSIKIQLNSVRLEFWKNTANSPIWVGIHCHNRECRRQQRLARWKSGKRCFSHNFHVVVKNPLCKWIWNDMNPSSKLDIAPTYPTYPTEDWVTSTHLRFLEWTNIHSIQSPPKKSQKTSVRRCSHLFSHG